MFGSQGRYDVRTRPAGYDDRFEQNVGQSHGGGRLKAGGHTKGKGSQLRAGQQVMTNNSPTMPIGNLQVGPPTSGSALPSSSAQIQNSQQFLDGLRNLQTITQNLIEAFDQMAAAKYETAAQSGKVNQNEENSQQSPNAVGELEDVHCYKESGLSPNSSGNDQSRGSPMCVGSDGKYKIHIPLFLKVKVDRNGNVDQVINLQFAEKVDLSSLPYKS